MTEMNNKRVWADAGALAADLQKMGFEAQVKGKKVEFSYFYIYGYVAQRRNYGPGDLSGVPGATISGTATVVDGATKLIWKIAVETPRGQEWAEPIPLEPVMATNRGSLFKQIRDNVAKATKGQNGVAARFFELLDGSAMAYELQGKNPKDRSKSNWQQPYQSGLDHGDALQLGKDQGTHRFEAVKPGAWLELVHEGKLIATLLVVEHTKGHLMAADAAGVYTIPKGALKVEKTARSFSRRHHWDLAEGVKLVKYRLQLDEAEMGDVRQALKEAK